MPVASPFVIPKCSDGGMGIHEGLKIPWPVMAVRVRSPFGVLIIQLNNYLILHEITFGTTFRMGIE